MLRTLTVSCQHWHGFDGRGGGYGGLGGGFGVGNEVLFFRAVVSSSSGATIA